MCSEGVDDLGELLTHLQPGLFVVLTWALASGVISCFRIMLC
jgi:hypothetical protein